MAMRCPKCGAKNRDDEAFCISCGVEIKAYIREQESAAKCPSCGAKNDGDSEFCISCGARLMTSEPSRVPPPTPPPVTMRCPNCSSPMLSGYLLAANDGVLGGGLRWSSEPSSFWRYTGEQIVEGEIFSSHINIQAWRCPGCRTVVFSY
jgi:hypothetical protein